MKLDGANKERLRELYEAQLCNCDKVPASFSPAKHRSTQVDVERTLQGTSDVPSRPMHPPARVRHSPSPSSGGKLQNKAGLGRHSASQKAGTATAADLEPGPASIYKTDFATASTASEAHHVAQLVATKLSLQSTSEWAMLNQLERTMVLKEETAKQATKQQTQQQQRQQLDQQVSQHENARQAAAAAKAAELAVTNADVEAYKAQEDAKAAAAEAAAQKLKAEREKQTHAAEAARQRQAAKKAREEAALLSAIKQQMSEAQEAAAAKAADAKAAAEAAKRANIEAKLAKQQASHKQQQTDEALMRETIKTLQKQEEAREAALKAFHDMIAARAVQAGAAAVAENKSRQEREERLVAASEAKAKAEAEAKHAAEVARKAALAADMRASAAAAAAANVAAEQLRKQEQAKLRSDMEADLQQFQQLQAMTAAERKAKNLQYKQSLEAQIAEAEARQVLDDVFMSEKERHLNKQLLTHAKHMLRTMGTTH